MRYSIPEQNIDNLEKKLLKIRNKCAKYGCEFRYERVGEHFEEKKFTDYNDVLWEVNGQRVYRTWTEVIKFIDIECEGTAAVNGWRFAASLEYTDKGNIIKGVEGIEIPSRYYKCAPWCEHCKTARDRKYSFIVLNDESGEFKQVGKACLKDFTGGLSAEAAALYESFFKEAEDASDWSGLGSFGKPYYKVEEFMRYCAETIRLYGYSKRDGYGKSTVDRADEIYAVDNKFRRGMSKYAIETHDEAVAKGFDVKRAETVELVGKVRDWILNNGRDDNYFHNLKVACALEWCDRGKIGLLASAFPAFNRDLEIQAEKREREAAEAEARAKSSWMGNVGDKVSFEIAECRLLTSWKTQWGRTEVYKFVSKDGLEATWKTSSWVDSRKAVGGVISGKVKELKEWNGIKQTELTRCKVKYPPEKGYFDRDVSPEQLAAEEKAQEETRKAFEEFMDYCERGA